MIYLPTIIPSNRPPSSTYPLLFHPISHHHQQPKHPRPTKQTQILSSNLYLGGDPLNKTQFRTNLQRPRSPLQHLWPLLPDHAKKLPWPPPVSHLSRSLFVTFFVCLRWVRENGKRLDEPKSDELLGGSGLWGRENLRVKGRVIANDGWRR